MAWIAFVGLAGGITLAACKKLPDHSRDSASHEPAARYDDGGDETLVTPIAPRDVEDDSSPLEPGEPSAAGAADDRAEPVADGEAVARIDAGESSTSPATEDVEGTSEGSAVDDATNATTGLLARAEPEPDAAGGDVGGQPG